METAPTNIIQLRLKKAILRHCFSTWPKLSMTSQSISLRSVSDYTVHTDNPNGHLLRLLYACGLLVMHHICCWKREIHACNVFCLSVHPSLLSIGYLGHTHLYACLIFCIYGCLYPYRCCWIQFYF